MRNIHLVSLGLIALLSGASVLAEAEELAAETWRVDGSFTYRRFEQQFKPEVGGLKGERLVELLKQPQYTPYAVEDQVVSIFLGTGGHLDSVPVEDVARFETELLEHVKASHEGIIDEIRETKKLSEEAQEKLSDVINEFKKGFSASDGSSVVNEAETEAMDEEDVQKESVKVRKQAGK